MDFVTQLATYDTQLFLFLNSLHNAFFDSFMITFSNMKVWIPFYVVVVYLLFKNEGKKALWLVLFLIVGAVLSDQFSVLIKNLVERPRPTHNANISNFVHTVNNYKGGPFGFVSSHAANTICFALLSSLIIRRKLYTISVFLWVAVTCYSRIYLGVHYPLDIVGGLIAGTASALLTFLLLQEFKPNALPRSFEHAKYALATLLLTVIGIVVYAFF
jgi:undecaprenyl-diphosphatase